MDEETAVVVCTCSTIGGSAEQTRLPHGQSVLRVDRAMAERAVEIGSRIVVAAALESTLAPTTELIQDVAAQQGARSRSTRCCVRGRGSVLRRATRWAIGLKLRRRCIGMRQRVM